jgi:lysyl-tRNA synthetase class I
MKPFFLYSGLKKLVQTLHGNENIYLGIRPYGFHAGNISTLAVYPYLLCNEIKEQGKDPKFKFYIFLNDWEQDHLIGPDTKKFPYNIHPENSTFQYFPSEKDPEISMADYWCPRIDKQIKQALAPFSNIKIKSVRNSEMKTAPVMKKHLLFTLKHPKTVADVLESHTDKKVLNEPLIYALAICPHCQKAIGMTKVKNKQQITHICTNCEHITDGKYEDFDYWFYHKPLAIPRLEKYDIDICITGMDHYKVGDYKIRQELIKAYKSDAKFPKTLYAPTILGKNGKPMGKGRGNTINKKFDYILKLVTKNPEARELKINYI